jgi:hypothetical protein
MDCAIAPRLSAGVDRGGKILRKTGNIFPTASMTDGQPAMRGGSGWGHALIRFDGPDDLAVHADCCIRPGVLRGIRNVAIAEARDRRAGPIDTL